MVCARLYRDTNRDTNRSMIVAGAARSGTTWLADIIASQLPCRVMFEPFHPHLVAPFAGFNYFQYMRPADDNEKLAAYTRLVLTGELRHRWVDRHVGVLRPQCRLIKEIRACLFLRWIHDRFPHVPLLFIVRHPCAVVASRLQLRWATDGDLEPMLRQPRFVDDFLAERVDLIRRLRREEEKHAAVWCLSNLVPLRQFRDAALHVVFYENLVLHPESEIPRLFRAIGQPYHESVFRYVRRASATTTRDSAVVIGKDVITRWRSALSSTEIANVLAVVEQLGLGHLYGQGVSPRPGSFTDTCQITKD